MAEHARADFDDIDLRLGQLIIVSELCMSVCVYVCEICQRVGLCSNA